MSSLIPPENRKLSSSGSPITMRPPVRAWRMLSIPSRSAVPGATISSALTSRGSWRLSSSVSSSPGRCAMKADSSSGLWRIYRCDALSSGSGGPFAALERRPDGLPEGPSGARGEDRAQAELGRLVLATVGVRDRAQLAREPDLPVAGERRGLRRDAAGGARHRQRDREIGAGLVDPYATDHVDEHVGAAHAHAGVAAEHGEHERQAVAVEPRAYAPRRHELARRDERLDLDQQRP